MEQWSARLIRNQWLHARPVFEMHQSILLFHYTRHYTQYWLVPGANILTLEGALTKIAL